MKLCILGWYGTETLGDRAILAGILHLWESNKLTEIYLGSLYSFFSERTIYEDQNIYEMFNIKANITIFNSRRKTELESYINKSDVILIGGGPLMDIDPLFMLKHAFSYAKKKHKKTMVFGCGIGPLYSNQYQKCVVDIMRNSDQIILRDLVSKELLLDIAQSHGINTLDIKIACDPAVICASAYKQNHFSKKRNDFIVLNFREFPSEYSKNKDLTEQVNKNLINFLSSVSQTFAEKEILLIPMHYFFIGNDDRSFLSKTILENSMPNVKLQNEPLNLSQTFDVFSEAEMAFGMRFHSVVLQTILNGNNYILDYTEINKGKIYGFISEIDKIDFYKNRYFNLQSPKSLNIEVFNINSKEFEVPNNYYFSNQKVYFECIEKIIQK